MNPVLIAVPAGVVTTTLPEAPLPTVAVMLVELLTRNDCALTPPKLTAVAPVKLVPVIVTGVPVPALTGVKEMMVGGGIKLNPDFSPYPRE